MPSDDARDFRVGAALSTRSDMHGAVDEAVAEVQAALAGPVDLAVMFVTHHHGPEFEPLVQRLRKAVSPRCFIGCTGESLAAGDREIEGAPAIVLWAARLPNVAIQPAHLTFVATPEGPVIAGWPDNWPAVWPAESAVLMLAEPFSFPADVLAARLNEEHPGIPLIGGMASGGWEPRQNRVFLDDRVYDEGAVALLLHGAIRVRTVVSQGCRPLGRTWVVTKAQQNVILELGGRPAYEVMVELYHSLTSQEQERMKRGLHLGLVINEYQDTFGHGDFLIRNVMGADPQQGAIAIGDHVRPGQTVQFHLRDAASADDDLRTLLAAVPASPGPRGALLFSCNGRGTRLFDEPNHDANAVQSVCGRLPLAGFFAQGELGPVGGKNFLHGFTASLALFEPAALANS